MKTITKNINVYTFDELSDSAKEFATEKQCQFNSKNWDADNIIGDKTSMLEMLGFYDVKIYYSGFYSQGSGACFTGKYSYTKDFLSKVKQEFPTYKELHNIAARLQELQRKQFYSFEATIVHRGMYYHENSMSYDIDMKNYHAEIENEFKEICKDLSKEIYANLRDAYEYDASEEHAKECILSDNDLLFLECGKVFHDV